MLGLMRLLLISKWFIMLLKASWESQEYRKKPQRNGVTVCHITHIIKWILVIAFCLEIILHDKQYLCH